MLRDDVIDDREVRGVVKSDALLAVMHVEIIGDDVFTQNEAVAETLHGDVVQNVVVVLIVGGDQSRDVTGIWLQFFSEIGVSDVLGQAEL